MKYTNNYNLKKPEGNDSVDIEDFNNNAEIIDFELAKTAAGLNLKIDSAKKSDSVTLDSSDSVATSKAVKVAYDKASSNETQLADIVIKGMNSKGVLASNANLNSITTIGAYQVGAASSMTSTPLVGDGSSWAILEVVPSGGFIAQRYHIIVNGGLKSYYRTRIDTGSVWSSWTRVLNQTDYDAINTQLAEIPTFQTAGGTATAITLTGISLTNGYSKTFIASATSTSTSKTINGKPFYKPGTVLSPSLAINKAYTVWYNLASDCFFIKASAEGTATVAQVLAGVPFSSEVDTGLIGTMPSNSSPTSTITTQGGTKVIPAGYNPGGTVTASFPVQASPTTTLTNNGETKTIPVGYNPGGTITVNITNLIASNIKKDVVVGGVTGTLLDGTNMKRKASGTASLLSVQDVKKYFSVGGLTFRPSTIIVELSNGGIFRYTYTQQDLYETSLDGTNLRGLDGTVPMGSPPNGGWIISNDGFQWNGQWYYWGAVANGTSFKWKAYE